MGSRPEQAKNGASRALVLAMLRQAAAPQTASQIARAVGLSLATSRFHLNQLLQDGLITAQTQEHAGRPGRPSLLYRALPAEAVDPGVAYRVLAGVLADQLVATGGVTSALAAGERWAAEISSQNGHPTHQPGAENTPSDRLQSILRVLEDGGFAPHLNDESTVVELHACPFMELAREHADVVCTVHLGLIRGLLGHDGPNQTGSKPGVRVLPVLDGSGPCLVRLPLPASTPNSVPWSRPI
jgi:predicted ArsR family transcriptional regulator